MAFTGPPRPLECAERVLKPEILYELVHCQSINRYGFQILDRWAVNQPEDLKELERQAGFSAIMIEVLTQQSKEQEVLEKNADQLANGLVAHEILEMNGVQTNLIL